MVGRGVMKDSEIYAQTDEGSRRPMAHAWDCDYYMECDDECTLEHAGDGLYTGHLCDCERRN